jgi:tetratricopeptide (TPR) repeat protein
MAENLRMATVLLYTSVLLPGLMMFFTTSILAHDADRDPAVESFWNHIQKHETIDQELKSRIEQTIDQHQDSAADAITESLILVYPEYAKAIEIAEQDELAPIVTALEPFTRSDDVFLAADASFYLARALMNAQHYEDALPLLQKVANEWAGQTAHTGNSRFYLGVAQAGLLDHKNAIQSFLDFLQFNPDAPERLRVAAWRQVQQLQTIKEGQMDDVYHRMDFSRRRLSLIETGDVTQEQQSRIVQMLAKLINEEEKKQCGNCNSQNTQQQQQRQQQQQQAQKQKSESQKGGSSNIANGDVVKRLHSDESTSPWSRLRDRSRDPANNAIKDKLPARYREIVERYYEAANGNDEK